LEIHKRRHRALPTGVLVRMPSPDVAVPLAPPMLGQPTTDRARPDDPTAEACAGGG
jgi:hypothetical protein